MVSKLQTWFLNSVQRIITGDFVFYQLSLVQALVFQNWTDGIQIWFIDRHSPNHSVTGRVTNREDVMQLYSKVAYFFGEKSLPHLVFPIFLSILNP